MVRFEKDKFIVEVPTAGNPAEDWLGTLNDLIDVLRSEDSDLRGDGHFHTFWLLQQLLPEREVAKKMVEE